MKTNKPHKAASKSSAIDEDRVVEMVADGFTQNEIAASFGVSRGCLRSWIAGDLGRSARVREAAFQSAQSYAEQALEVIRLAKDPFELAKAREEAQHLRWAASKANPSGFGDKQQIDVNATVKMTQEDVDAKIAVLLAKMGK